MCARAPAPASQKKERGVGDGRHKCSYSLLTHTHAHKAHPIDTKPQDELSKKQLKKKKMKELEARERAMAQKAQVSLFLPRWRRRARAHTQALIPMSFGLAFSTFSCALAESIPMSLQNSSNSISPPPSSSASYINRVKVRVWSDRASERTIEP